MDSSLGPLTDPEVHADSGSRTLATRRMAIVAGAVAGATGALLAAGIGLWMGQRTGGVITAQLLADRITGVTPVSVFGRVMQQLEENAKPLTLLGLTLAQMLAGAGIGAGFGLMSRVTRIPVIVGAMLVSLVAWLILSLIVAPLGQIGVMAADAPGGAGSTQVLFIVSATVFGVVTAYATRALSGSGRPVHTDPSRRRLAGRLGVAGLVVPALLAGGYTTRYALRLRHASAAVPAPIAEKDDDDDPDDGDPFTFAGMPHFVTPTPEFYVVSKNIVDPKVDGSTWMLEIDGMVRQPLSLSLTDLLARESVEFTSTLECISNPVGGKYISNAVWQGVPLASLLEEAGLADGIVDLELHAADGYVESIPLAEGLAADTVVVHTMNGEPLKDQHGFPARLIVPGIYGMKNVKWITKITAVDEDILGYWQQRGWSDPAPVLTMSRVDTPASGARLVAGKPFIAGGVAFAGDRGLSGVEVSFDEGATWVEADLSDVPGDLTWRLWRAEHLPGAEGRLEVRVRATDGTGDVQTAEQQPPLPDGSTGHHNVRFSIVSGG
jgi:DMSO/TMAO reductase YedYZ molybdopterin-dependent catalytic subunit